MPAVFQETFRATPIDDGNRTIHSVEIACWLSDDRMANEEGVRFRTQENAAIRCDVINNLVIKTPRYGVRIVTRNAPGTELLRLDGAWIPESEVTDADEAIGWTRESYTLDKEAMVQRAIERFLTRIERKSYQGDMRGTTLTEVVVDGNGDADEREAGTGFSSTNSTFKMAANTSSLNWWAGFHFDSVAIPAGATINSATMDVYVNASTDDDPDGDLHMEDADSPSDFSANADVSGRTITTAFTSWNASNIGSGWQISPDFASAVQEVVDRGGWASGNNLCALWRGDRVAGGILTMRGYDYNSSYAANLDIDYTEGGALPSMSLLGVGK